MGFFNKRRTDGITYDGQGEERTGLIDVIQYNGLPEDILWKFPYDNITTGARLIVQEGQEALFLANGSVQDVLGPNPEGHVLSTNNIPFLQKLYNLPYGGRSPFKAQVVFVNLTDKRNLKFGTPEAIGIDDPTLDDMTIGVKVRGQYGIRIVNSTALLKYLAGTKKDFTTEDVKSLFGDWISGSLQETLGSYVQERQISVTKLKNNITEISQIILKKLEGEFEQYGISFKTFTLSYCEVSKEDPNFQYIQEQQRKAVGARSNALAEARLAQGHAEALRIQGTNYQQERQFDVMETAAGNEGAGQFMGAGMGLGMGFGMGNAFGTQANQMASGMTQAAPPPPPPAPAAYHILVNNVQEGPYGIDILRQKVQAGALTRDTYVWKNGMPQWDKAQNCPELQSLFAAVPPPPPVI